MYFPYLRGKQEELLALQELLNGDRLSEKITPVIEPVKLSSTFINTLQLFIEKGRKVYIIQNPTVGNFDDELVTNMIGDEDDKEKRRVEILIENQKKYAECQKSPHIELAFLYASEDEEIISDASAETKIALVFTDDDQIEDYKNGSLEGTNIEMMFVPEIGSEDGLNASLLLFRDRFKKAPRNSDYLENDDEFFTKDNLIYAKNDFYGFSDYSIVGKGYDEAGFSPYAVAIHIIYLNSETAAFRIRHFVSDTNHSSKNPALKFSEAMKKLVAWCSENPEIQSLGLDRLTSFYHEEKYPGLGSVKRYSIMHHLEIVGKHLG